MDDKTLLERAAKAYGVIGEYVPESRHTHACISFTDEDDCEHGWNPLIDDGEALRLAVALHLDVNFYPHSEEVGAVKHRRHETYHRAFARVVSGDWSAATRRAIVRAAAALAEV